MYRIRRFGVLQTATTVAAIYVFVVAILPCLRDHRGHFRRQQRHSSGALGLVVVAVLAALFYGVFGWIATAIGCAIYNVVSGWVGGIEVQIDPVAPPPPPPAWGPITAGGPPPLAAGRAADLVASDRLTARSLGAVRAV